jgi:hypothetical protein
MNVHNSLSQVAKEGMNATLRLAAFVLPAAMLMAACRPQQAEPSKPVALANPAANPGQAPPAEVKTVRLDALVYHDPLLRERLTRLDAGARRIAGRVWHHRPWHERWHDPSTSSARKAWMDYYAMWCPRSEQASHICTRQTERPVHCILLTAAPHRDNARKVCSVYLLATYYPAGEGWGAQATYRLNKEYADDGRLQEEFGVVLFHDKWKLPGADYAFVVPGAGFGLVKRFGQVEYKIGPPDSMPLAKRPPHEFLASAEAFRDHGLGVLDELEPLIRQYVESGAALRGVTDYGKTMKRTEESFRRGLPPETREVPAEFTAPLPQEYMPTAAQKQEIIAELLAEVAQRRSLLREHYREMYAAANHAFPLGECLSPKAEE